jgi:peroxiredoxin
LRVAANAHAAGRRRPEVRTGRRPPPISDSYFFKEADVSVTPIAEQVSSFRSSQPAAPPSAFDLEQQQLAGHAVDGVIAAGVSFPDAELLDVHGSVTTLLAVLDGRRTVLVFYRGAWCPFCNIALRAYQDELLPALLDRGIKLLAVSPQKPDGSLTMQQKNELTFTVVSDSGNMLAAAAGILTGPSEEARAQQLELGLDLTAVNADGTTTLPMPTTLIVDADGTVRWIDVHPDYSTRTEPADILAALDALAH